MVLTGSVKLVVEQGDRRSEDRARKAGAADTFHLALHHEGNSARLRSNVRIRAPAL
jgi:hypothetical protein